MTGDRGRMSRGMACDVAVRQSHMRRGTGGAFVEYYEIVVWSGDAARPEALVYETRVPAVDEVGTGE